jgi:hypothetical protein
MAEQMSDFTAPLDAASALSESLADIARRNRALAQAMAHFTREEYLRFFQMRLDRDTTAIGKLGDVHGVPGLIGVQQEWLRDLFQDYAGQQMRLAGLMRDMSHNAMDRCSEMAGMGLDTMRAAAGEMQGQMQEAGKEVQATAEEMAATPAEMAENGQHETQH